MGKVKPQESQPVTIGAAASAAGITTKAARLYERRGLLAAPIRTAAGYRLYTDTDIARLRFIAAARSLGLHLDQIAEILAAAHDGQRPCHTTRAILDQRIGEIDDLISSLSELRASLTGARDRTTRHTAEPASICPVIESQAGARSSRHTGATSS